MTLQHIEVQFIRGFNTIEGRSAISLDSMKLKFFQLRSESIGFNGKEKFASQLIKLHCGIGSCVNPSIYMYNAYVRCTYTKVILVTKHYKLQLIVKMFAYKTSGSSKNL